jgi:hypothetical protein
MPSDRARISRLQVLASQSLVELRCETGPGMPNAGCRKLQAHCALMRLRMAAYDVCVGGMSTTAVTPERKFGRSPCRLDLIGQSSPPSQAGKLRQ